MKRGSAPGSRLVASLLAALGAVVLVPLGADSSRTQPQTPRSPFVPDEMTIASIHTAFSTGALTCTQLVQSYLNRIDAYDDRGPALNAILTLVPKADRKSVV